MGKPARGKKCPAIDGILEEGNELLEQHEPGPAFDAAMAGAAQAVEHYEIARYGTLVAWATELGHADAAALLDKTLEQEEATDEALSKLATTELNPAAKQDMSEGGDEPAAMRTKSAAKPKSKPKAA